MNSTMKLFGFFLFALALSFMACKGEDGLMGTTGPVGAAGIDGVDGIDGVNGTNGVDGRDGADGQDGTNGQDGEDGNANVFASPWGSVPYSPATGTFGAFNMNAPEITIQAMEEAVILGFLRTTSTVFTVPKVWTTTTQLLDGRVIEGAYRFLYYGESSWTPPTLEGRYVVIPPAGRHIATGSPKQAIIDEMTAAGVDIENFEAVAKFHNIIE